MAAFPYLPLYVDDLHMDTRHLTNEQFGLYVKLLMAAWRAGDNALPNDPAMICKWIGETGHRRGKVMALVAEFFDLEDGVWRQRRLEKVRRKVVERYRQRVDASEAAKSAKALKKNKPPRVFGEPTQNQTIYKDRAAGPPPDISLIKSGKRFLCGNIPAARAREWVELGYVTQAECESVGVL